MKPFISFLFLAFMSLNAGAQDAAAAQKLVKQGVEFHDAGDFKAALECYDKVLKLDKNNTDALYEKSFTLSTLEKYDEVIVVCKKILTLKPDDNILQSTYATLGNAYDAVKEPKKAIKIYDEGIKKFPSDYMLHFNKGVTLAGLQQITEAQTALEEAIRCNPKHPGSLNALGRILYDQDKKIPAILVLSRFLAVEVQSKRAAEDFVILQKLLTGNATKTGKNSITINMDAKAMNLDKKAANNFSFVEMRLALKSALRLATDSLPSTKNEIKQFTSTMQTICELLKTQQSEGTGFYWTFFAPYLIAMEDQKHLETFAYLAHAASPNKDVEAWVDAHEKELGAFFDWSKNFKWRK
jgi:tetratricopeptide (TPR) repeat protein